MDFYRRYELANSSFPLLEWYTRQCGTRTPETSVGLVMADTLRPTQLELKENSSTHYHCTVAPFLIGLIGICIGSRSAVLHVLTKQQGVRVSDVERVAYGELGWQR